jgi:DNA-binding LacI/PurR family transcriptional regulator
MGANKRSPDSDRPIGIKEVAAAAGVSTTTVSHALNGKGRLPDATRRHVHDVAEQLGYRASATARHFAAGRSGLVALALSEEIAQTFAVAGFTFYAQLMVGAAERCLEHGFALVLAGGASAGEWLTGPPDAVLGVDPVAGDPVWKELTDAGVPHVTVGRPVDGDGCPWVDNDHRAAARQAFEHLRARGAERIAVIGTGLTTSVEADIRAEYEVWCAAEGHAPLHASAGRDLSASGGFDAMRGLLRGAAPPDAVYATVDRLALGAALAASAQGFAVPDGVMIVACGDCEAAEWTHPSLTAVDLAAEEIAEHGIDMLVGMINGSAPQPAPRLVPTRLVERESTRRAGRREPVPPPEPGPQGRRPTRVS